MKNSSRELSILKRIVSGSLLLLGLWSGTATAISDLQYQAISQLGQLNGVALQCGYIGQTRAIKAALVSALPKRRALGQAFDDQTNRAFLAFIEEQRGCPAPAEFAERVTRGIRTLEQAFTVK